MTDNTQPPDEVYLYWYDRHRITHVSKCDTLEDALRFAMSDHERGEAAYVGIEAIEDGTSRIIEFTEMYNLWTALPKDPPDPEPAHDYWAVRVTPPGGGHPCLADTFLAEQAARSTADQMRTVLGDRVSIEHVYVAAKS